MDTGKLKRFAAEARVNLMDGVRRKLRVLGFDEYGHVGVEPELLQGATLYKGEEYPEAFYHQWKTLKERIASHGVREVVEEAAYTWFNRMMAIRILTKNELCEPILMTEGSASGYPLLLEAARMGRVPEMNAQERRRFDKLMEDDNLTSEQFSLLLTVWCHYNPIINACFGSVNGYAELLLPDNIIRPDGFIALLNNTGFITDDDFKSAELIGWLYQFYISERKDEVMKKQKYAADEIPAATQIFTPNWIVKYMVENTILPQVEASEEILEDAKYLVKNPDATPCKKVDLEDLKVADFACGSGHILNECFDLLFALYRDEAYSRKEAIEAILTKNLLGIDIDLRAKQLAMFALLLKACQKDNSFADAHCLPRVLTVPDLDKEYFYVAGEIDPKGYLHHFFLGSETPDCSKELAEAIITLKDADVLGSIIKFDISGSTRRQLSETVAHWKSQRDISHGIMIGLPVMDFILALTDSYDAIVMNPPYMATNKDDVLKKYAVENYSDSKADLFTVFMDVAIDRLKDGGRYGMINMQSWMFLSSFESLRKKIIKEQQIESLLHLGPRTFDELSGEVVQNAAFIIIKSAPFMKGTFYRLVYGGNCNTKASMFIEPFELEDEFLDDRSILFKDIDQNNFSMIPGNPIAYWVNDAFVANLDNATIGEIAHPRRTIQCGDVERFIRLWFEVDNKDIDNRTSIEDLQKSTYKWFKFSNGGCSRKWYGNLDSVLYWGNNGQCIKNTGKAIIPNENLYFKCAVGYNRITSSGITARMFPKGILLGDATSILTPSIHNTYLLGLLNSKVSAYSMTIFNPTLAAQTGSLSNIPCVFDDSIDLRLIDRNITISKVDWDAHETSWDYQQNELVFLSREGKLSSIEQVVSEYTRKWENLFVELHDNENELNRLFIQLYGLQDVLIPNIPIDEVSILQQGEKSINYEGPYCGTLTWHRDVIIKQLISYIVGCYMGRYRLDNLGLAIAHPNPTEEELADYTFNIVAEETFKIDPDAIIPVLPQGAPFYDNLINYVSDFIRKVWGKDTHTENMNFIDRCLGKPLNDYLMKDFWKYHKKMYQNRPIYWEFASPKGAFRALVYDHRMDKFTVEVLRSKYLLPYINFIEQKITNLDARANDLSTAERRELDNLRKKTLPELREYHDRVQQIAAETAARETVFDLDDGIPHNHALFGSIVTKLK